MRAVLAAVVALLILASLLSSCSDGDESQNSETPFYTVTFNSNGGSAVAPIEVKAGDKIAKPADPTRENFLFNGWMKGNVIWDFEGQGVSSDITLTAQWVDARTVFEYTPENDGIVITKYKGELENINIPSVIAGYQVIGIADSAFADLSSEKVSSVTVPEGVTSIGASAFNNCAGINISVRGEISSLGENAFYGCDGLASVKLVSGLTEIPYEAFSGCAALTSVVIPDSVTVIRENAFEECSKMQTITLPASLTSVEDSAFNGCTALKSIFYYGTPEQWELVSVATGGNGNDDFIAAKCYFYSPEEPTDGMPGWYFDSNGNVRCW